MYVYCVIGMVCLSSNIPISNFPLRLPYRVYFMNLIRAQRYRPLGWVQHPTIGKASFESIDR